MHVDNSTPPIPPSTASTTPAPALMPPMPMSWRIMILAAIFAAGLMAYAMRDAIGVRGQAAVGVACFFGLVAAFSQNLRAVKWSTIYWGIGLQIALALLVLKVPIVYAGIENVAVVVRKF